MKSINMTILKFSIVFIGITLCFSQGWAADNLKVQRERVYSCTKQGPEANETIDVKVRYIRKLRKQVKDDKFIWELESITVPDKSFKVRKLEQPYIYLREKNPAKRGAAQARAGKIVYTSSPDGINCAKNNYPFVVVAGQIYFLEKQ